MRWDRHTLTEFGGIAALVVVGALLFKDAGVAFVPVIGMVGGVAAMALANHERLKQRIESLETRLAQAEWTRRDQPRRLNSGSGNRRFARRHA